MSRYEISTYQQGVVKRLLSTPCHPDIDTWIEASVPILVGAVGRTIFYPDLKHLYHTLTGEALIGSAAKAPAGFLRGGSGFGRTVSQVAPGSDYGPLSQTSQFFRAAGKVASIYDGATFYAWVLSLAENSLVNWASLAFALTGCTPGKSFYSVSGQLNNGACNLNSWNNAFDAYYDDPLHGVLLTGTAANAPPNWPCICAASASYYYLNGFPAPTALRVRDANTGEIYDYDETLSNAHNGFEPAKVWQHSVANPSFGTSLAAEAMLTAPGPFNVAVAATGSFAGYPNTNVIGAAGAPHPNQS